MRLTAAKMLLLLAVLALLGGATAVILTTSEPGRGRSAPAAISTPSADRDPVRGALLAGLVTSGRLPTEAGLLAKLTASLQDPRLGGVPAFAVVDVLSSRVLASGRGNSLVVPASTAKIATAVAVLLATEPDQRLRTTVVAGPAPGEVVLIGGGDPTLAGPEASAVAFGPARLVELAAQVRSAMGRTRVTRVLVDDTLFVGGSTGPGWKPSYVSSGNVAPVMALSLDGGRVHPEAQPRVLDPALAAGRAFAQLLDPSPAAGAQIVVARGAAAPSASRLGSVASPPIPVLVEQMLERSDNDIAEAMTRQVALARGLPASFAGGGQAVTAVLSEFAGPAVAAGVALQDGSGLSREDRVEPASMAALLAVAARTERLRPLLGGLPVAGFDGTLAERFRSAAALPAAGRVRAKTGTLDGISALAGLVRTSDGRLLAFDITADAVRDGATTGAEAALDVVAATLASCGCG